MSNFPLASADMRQRESAVHGAEPDSGAAHPKLNPVHICG